jgi:hypothetical protein
MTKLRVIDLDVWGNAEDGYEIENFFNVGVLEFPRKKDVYDIPEKLIKKKLVENGYFPSSALRKIELNSCSSMSYFYQVEEKKTGRPLFHLYELETETEVTK